MKKEGVVFVYVFYFEGACVLFVQPYREWAVCVVVLFPLWWWGGVERDEGGDLCA